MPNDTAKRSGRAAAEPAHAADANGSRSRSGILALALLSAAMLVSLVWFVHPWYDPANDASMYILTGRNVVRGEGYSMLGEAFRIRPPGFTWMIAPLLALRGTDFFALNLFVSLWGVLGCALLFCFARARLGTWLALLVALVVWLNPGYQELCNQPMSDVPGTTLLLVGLLLERWCEKRPSWKRDLVLGVFLGSAAYVRTVLLLLAPSIVAMRLLKRWLARGGEVEPWRAHLVRAGLCIGAAVLMQVPWSVRNARLDTPHPVDQTLLYSYGTGMFHEDMGDPESRRLSVGEVLARFPERSGEALEVLGRRMITRGESEPWIAFFLIACIAIVWLKRRDSAEFYTLGTLAIISVYFGFAARLMLPIWVLAIPAATEVVRDVGRLALWPFTRSLNARGARAAGLVVATGVLGLVLATDTAPRYRWKRIERKHLEDVEVARRFEARMQPDAVLAAGRAWHYGVLLDRDVYAFEFTWKRSGRTQDLEAMIDKYGINTVILSPRERNDRDILPYFEKRYGPSPGRQVFVYRVR